MGIFSGIGGAYMGMGLANAMNQIPVTNRMLEDRRRAQAKEDEALQQRRDEIASEREQRAFTNKLATNRDTREGAMASLQQQEARHTIDRYGKVDANTDAEAEQRLGALQYANSPEQRGLQNRMLNSRINYEGAAAGNMATESQLHNMQLQNAQTEQRRQSAIRDADTVNAQAEASNDPSVWRSWFLTHMPDGHDINIVPNKSGGWDVQHLVSSQARPGAAPTTQVVNTTHMANLGDFQEQAMNMVDQDQVRKMQQLGIHRGHYIQARGEGDVPLNFDQRTGQYMTQDGKPYRGKLAPSASSAMFGAFGQPQAAAQPGSVVGQYLPQRSAQPQQQGAAVNDDDIMAQQYVGGN